MLKPKQTPKGDYSPRDLTCLWRRLFEEHYGRPIPGTDAPDYWVRHYMGMKRLTDELGDGIWVATLFHWWFKAGITVCGKERIVQDPSGLGFCLKWFKAFLRGNKGLIEKMGPEKGVDYLLTSSDPDWGMVD